MRRRLPMTAALSIALALTPTGTPAVAGDAPPPATTTTTSPAQRPVSQRVRVTFRPPVDAPVSDPFRPPATPYGPGNRGVDYATQPGWPVVAAAGGVVTFAGQVGGTLHVVVLHDDSIRTTYSLLASVAVAPGQHVVAGQLVGTTGTDLHFGARAGRAYVDPLVLVQAPHPGRARLLPIVGGAR